MKAKGIGKVIKRNCLWAIFTVSLLLALCVSAGAESYSDISVPKEYSGLVESLPSEIEKYLPEGLYSSDPSVQGEAVASMSGWEYISSLFSSVISLGVYESARLLAAIVAVLTVSAVFSAFRSSISSGALSRAISLSSGCALIGTVAVVLIAQIERVVDFFERLSLLVNGMIPVMGVLYAMGGNVTTAAASHGTLYLFLSFCENLCATSAIPVAGLLTAFAFCSALQGTVNLRGLSSALRRCYVFVLILVMTVLLATLSSQTLLSSSADSLSSRAAKLVASNVIPIVGGSVGETLRTVASSVGYIKNVCGVGMIAFIVILVLPVFVTLLLSRFVFIVSVAVADILGCESESRLLSELGGVYGVLIAAVAISSVSFILALTVFLRCTVAAL